MQKFSPTLWALLLVGCSDSNTAPETSSTAIPRLDPGPHLGMITGFDALDTARSELAAGLYAEAADAGASIGRVQVDWAELETDEGVYDDAALDELFSPSELDGMNVYLTLSTLDSDAVTFPDYLMNDDDGLREGLSAASPEVTTAFTNFLSWLGEKLMEREVWALSIGNEVDSPVGDGIIPEADAGEFYKSALDHWNREFPEIASTLTFTIAAPERTSSLFQTVRDNSDFVTFNYYCLFADLTVSGPEQWGADLADMKVAAGEREIFIQELGCPVGYSPQGQATNIGGSLENQEAFFRFFGEQFVTDSQLRAATLFQLFDWSPELSASFNQPIRDAGEELAADRSEEWLETVGLVRWTDSTERPAWEVWLSQIEAVAFARNNEE